MKDRRWPLGASERPDSRASLASSGREKLRDWLYLSALSWSQSEDDGERLASFSPLALNPQEPARQVANWNAGLPTGDRLEVEAALADTIEAWDPARDRVATVLLLKLAGHIGGRRAAGVINSLLSKSLRGSDTEMRDIAEAVAFFGRKHATGDEARNLAYRLRDVGLGVPSAVIVLLVRAAADFGPAVVDDFRILTPDVIEERLHDPYIDFHVVAALRRFTANTLVNDMGASAAFRLALQAQRAGMPSIREALLLFRLEARIDKAGQARLRDTLTWTETIVDVSDIPLKVRAEPPAVAINDNLITKWGVERLFAGAEQ